jgi:hypothetical protein
MGHRTKNDEMMRVPRDLADYVRTEAPKRGLSYMDFMRELVFLHMDQGDSVQARKATKPKAKKPKVKQARPEPKAPEPQAPVAA